MKHIFLFLIILLSDFSSVSQNNIFDEFKFDCNYTINIINSDVMIRNKNSLVFHLLPNDRILITDNLNPGILEDFLRNNGDGSCNYCHGLKDPTSSDNPNKAAIIISKYQKQGIAFGNAFGLSLKEIEKRENEMLSNSIAFKAFQEILIEAYESLWKDEYNRINNKNIQRIDFKHINCNTKNFIRHHFPINIMYTDQEGMGIEAFFPPSELKKSESETIIEPLITNIISTKSPNNIPFTIVDVKPLYPGCEKSNNQTCTRVKITEFLNSNFDKSKAEGLGLKGRYRIITQFTINQLGEVENILVRAPHPKLEDEAKRLIKQLPVFLSGFHDNKKVDVLCSFPISIEI